LPDPVFDGQGWGGYLICRWYPEHRVFIDGRIDMYGQEIGGNSSARAMPQAVGPQASCQRSNSTPRAQSVHPGTGCD
jgi:hypothetical protein